MVVWKRRPARGRIAPGLRGLGLAAAVLLATVPALALEPIVIGQSLPISGADPSAGRAIREGAEAYVRYVNEHGGVAGRQINLITLDDGGNIDAYRRNLQRLVSEENATAIINCLGDLYCNVAAEKADASEVPLVGAMSGSLRLRGRARNVFHTRADYAQEAGALARQLKILGVRKLAYVKEAGSASEQAAVLRAAFDEAGIAVESFELRSPRGAEVDKLLAAIDGRFDAATLDVGADAYVAFAVGMVGERREWPAIMTTLAGPSVRLLARSFRGRMVGFTTVVPNPERVAIPLVREFQKNVDKYVAGSAVSFEGLEAYLNTRLCIAALKRTRSGSARELAAVLGELRELDVDGFTVRIGGRDGKANHWVDVGVVSRQGALLD